jgi:hypothetical protein
MEICCYGKGYIGQEVLYVPQLCVIFLVDCHFRRYGLTHIRSHAASDSWFFRFYVPFLNVCLGSYSGWLQLQRRGRLTGVCIAVESRQVAHYVKRLLFGWIRLQSHLEDVFQEPGIAAVEM